MKTLKHLLLAASATLLGSLATAQAQLLINDADRTFLQQTSQRDAFEIIGGQLPRSHSTLAVVRRFGNQITRNNNQDAAQVRALALRFGVPVSLKPSADEKTELSELGELFNVNFDQAWVNKEIRTILEDIRASLTVIKDGSNIQVRAFARRRLPTLYAELKAGLITAVQIGLPLR